MRVDYKSIKCEGLKRVYPYLYRQSNKRILLKICKGKRVSNKIEKKLK
jgi:hypothetical protein